MINMIKNKKILLFSPLVIFILIIISFFLPISFIILKKTTERSKILTFDVSSTVVSPYDVKISNFFPFGFTISFVTGIFDNKSNFTPKKAQAEILLSENSPIEAEKGIMDNVTIIPDKKGESYLGSIHYFEIKNLKPETLYSFKIKIDKNIYSYRKETSAWITNGSSQDLFLVKTPKIISDFNKPPSRENPYGAYSLEDGAFLPCPEGNKSNNPSSIPCFRPNPVLIKINQKSDVLIYAFIQNSKKERVSSLLSCLTDKNGSCLIDLANFYTEDFSSYLPYDHKNDKIIIWANGGELGNSQPVEKPIPEVFADECLNNPLSCNFSPKGERVITLSLTPFPTISPTITSNINPSPSPEITPPECNLIGDLNCDGKVNEADFSVIFQNWKD